MTTRLWNGIPVVKYGKSKTCLGYNSYSQTNTYTHPVKPALLHTTQTLVCFYPFLVKTQLFSLVQTCPRGLQFSTVAENVWYEP